MIVEVETAGTDEKQIYVAWPNLRSGLMFRVSYTGGARIPPPPRNLKIEYGYYCGAINISYLILHVTGHKYEQSTNHISLIKQA